jgi:Cu/Ag efflux protein CusF
VTEGTVIMSRLLWSAIVVMLVWPAAEARAQAPNVVTTETTVRGTVDRIERSIRVVTLRQEGNVFQSVYVDPKVKEFDALKVGDAVTVRYVESVIVQVRPGAALNDPRDTTEEARKAGQAQVVQQTKATVTIEEIDSQGLTVTYRTQDNRKLLRQVHDKRLLEGIRRGDRVEVTMTRERAVSIERGR